MTEIERNVGNDRKKIEVTGLMESDPEYQLIVEANNIAVEIDGEIGRFFIRILFLYSCDSFMHYTIKIKILVQRNCFSKLNNDSCILLQSAVR